jgi:cytoskeletal protein CcmA (bactofilin family)
MEKSISRGREYMKKNSQLIWRISSAMLVLMLSLLAIVPTVHAAEINNNGVLKAGETINDDLMLTGKTVQMDGTVNGMLVATGSTVIINGTVNGDLIALGQTVTITENGSVNGNIFTAAQIISMDGKVTGSVAAASMSMTNGKTSAIQNNLYYVGYSLAQSKGSSIGRDIRAGVYQAILEGDTGQDAVVYGEAVEVSGNIDRNAEFIVGNPASDAQVPSPYMANSGITRYLKPGLRVNPMAVIGGVMNYTSKVNQSSQIEATPAGGVVFQTPIPSAEEKKAEETTPAPVATTFGFLSGFTGFAGNLISLLLIGGLLLWKFPVLLDQNVSMVREKPWAAMLYGLVTIVVGYFGLFLLLPVIILVSIIIGFITIGGLSGATAAIGLSTWAAVFAIFSLAIFHVSKVIVAYLIGKWIFSKSAPTNTSTIWPMVIGVFVYAVLCVIPLFSLLLEIAVVLLGVGAMWLVFKQKTAPVGSVITTA